MLLCVFELRQMRHWEPDPVPLGYHVGAVSRASFMIQMSSKPWDGFWAWHSEFTHPVYGPNEWQVGLLVDTGPG